MLQTYLLKHPVVNAYQSMRPAGSVENWRQQDPKPSGYGIRCSWRLESLAVGEAASVIGKAEDQPLLEQIDDAERSDEVAIAASAKLDEQLSEGEKALRARRRVEAILFLSRDPLSARKIAALASLADATQARTLTRQLNELYRAESHAFQIDESAGGYVMMTRPQFARWLRRLDQIPADVKLGQPALETLTIIAYRQPVVRAYIESVRGANCDEVLRQLLERDLIRIAGRSEDLGRPYLYGTTKRFLQLFGLRSLEHLPKKDWVLELDLQFANPSSEDSIHETETD